MARKITLIFIFFISLVFFACSSQERLGASTHRIEISSSRDGQENSHYILVEDNTPVNIQFYAKIISPNNKVISINPQWSVDDENSSIDSNGLFFSPDTITQAQNIKITASYDGISTSVGYNLTKEIPTQGERTNRYYLFADMFQYMQDFVPNKINDGNDSTNNGGYIGKLGDNLGFEAITDNAFEGFESLKLTYNNSIAGNGIFFVFGYKEGSDGKPSINQPLVYKDLSKYTKLVFYIYSNSHDTPFSVTLKSQSTLDISYDISLSAINQWQKISLNIASDFSPAIDMSNFEKLLFSNTSRIENCIIYLDNIYFE
ncbi:MAG: hypothetical protein GY817_08260 [bacterium]|nr:hypothetical protein [bacterium]